MIEVRNNPAESRYEVLVDGGVVGFADYRVDGNVLTAPHTEVDPEHGGKGLAGKLITQLLDDAKEAGQQVLPVCPFVSGYIKKNPQYRELVPEQSWDRFQLTDDN